MRLTIHFFVEEHTHESGLHNIAIVDEDENLILVEHIVDYQEAVALMEQIKEAAA